MEKKSLRLTKLVKACGVIVFTGLLAFNVFTYINSGSTRSDLAFSALDAKADDPESEGGTHRIFEVLPCTAYVTLHQGFNLRWKDKLDFNPEYTLSPTFVTYKNASYNAVRFATHALILPVDLELIKKTHIQLEYNYI